MAGEYSPLDYGGAIAYANNAVPDYVTEQLKQAQAQAMRAAAVTNAQQEARLQQVEMDKRQKLADYQREVEELGANPTPQQVARFMVRNPDVADKIKSAYDMQDETTRRQNFTRISSLAILAQKDPKAVAAKLREQAASDPEPDDDLEVARMLDSDDEAERNQGLAQLHMLSYVATGDHDKYLEAHKAYETPEYKAIGDTNLITDNRGNIWRGPVTRGDSFIDPGYYNYPLLGGAAGPPATGGAAPAPAPAASGGFDVANAPQLHPETAFDRMLTVETNGRQFDRRGKTMRSPKGALGIAQVMPGTGPEAARLAGEKFDLKRLATDADYNRKLGKAYFAKQVQDFGNIPMAVAAYNGGPARMRRALKKGGPTGWLNHLPAETQKYVQNVFGQAEQLDEARIRADAAAAIAAGANAEAVRAKAAQAGVQL